MGYGDEIIGSGWARGAAARGKRIAFGDGRKIMWGPFCPEVYERNPNVAHPGQEKAKDIEWIGFHRGARGYSTLNATRDKWIWNYKHRMPRGEFFFSDVERAFASSIAPGFIVMEPNLQWQKPVSLNKDWGAVKYIELARRLTNEGHRLIQFKHKNTRTVLPGVELVEVMRFRDAIAIMERASLCIICEGGMMHAAAAVNVKAVVLFGGWSPPIVCGYPDHVNLVGSDEACGNVNRCDHCHKAMAKISVEEVEQAANGEIRNGVFARQERAG